MWYKLKINQVWTFNISPHFLIYKSDLTGNCSAWLKNRWGYDRTTADVIFFHSFRLLGKEILALAFCWPLGRPRGAPRRLRPTDLRL